MTREPPISESSGADARDAERTLAGEVEAFAGIVHRWQGPLINLAYRYCRDRGTAEELAQEAFLKIYRNLRRWRGEGSFSTWLFAVALNVYRSWARKRRPPLASLKTLEQIPAPVDRQGPERRQEDRLVREAVRALPGRYRDAVLLYYFHDMDLRRTAETLGRPEGTVKARLHRARKLLERHLSRRLGAEGSREMPRRETAGTNRRPNEVPRWTGSIEH